jgi:cell wall-associated NlpC family hydrolase
MFAWKTAKERPAHRRHPLSAALLVGTITAAALLGTSAPAQAASGAVHARAHFAYAWQSTVTHEIHVHGAAVDHRHPHQRITVGLFVHGKLGKKVVANDSTPRARSVGRHGFSTVLHWPHGVHHVRLAVYENGHRQMNPHARLLGHRTLKGEKIVSVARHYVGSAYVYGADGPNAFDCSGYAMFVYKQAHVASLPHNSEAQRHARHMHRVARRHARPGDLVFYMSGGSSYHVAIYAGHGMQYSATDPAQGVEHDHISSHNVVFGTNWH